MITKAKRLQNIGKFYDFSSGANDLDWHRNTFIFAPNAYGKTTFVNVLRSLRDNDSKLIRSRKTLGDMGDQKAVIVIDGVNHVFNGSRWENPYHDIQIFDAPFIQSNILTHEIGHEHKKNIHKIIIGEQGKNLAGELAALKTGEKAKNQEVERLVEQFKRGGFTQDMNTILSIPAAEETAVGERIRKMEQDIRSKESEEAVQKLGHSNRMVALSFDLSSVKTLASKKLVAVHEAAERDVLAHIDRNFKDKPQAKQFIRQGIDAMQADCPFCGQDIKNAADLLKAYREFFDETFRAYQQGVVQQLTSIKEWNLDNELTALISLHNANLATVRQWEKYLGEIKLPDFAATVDGCRAELAASKGNVLSELGRKQQDPNVDVDLSPIDALTTGLAALKAAVDEYNEGVTAFTEKAKQYVANLPRSDVASIRADLTKQQEIKKRFTPEWKVWATAYPEAKNDADSLQTQKNAKQKALEDYGTTIFDTYQKRVNELLKTLGTDFTLAGLTGKTDDRANESYSDFGFIILGKDVPLTARVEETPCFKNTLSEGDKSTLAFAFFMAALEKQPDLDKQIIVFDDPLSSLDETRREATARLLLALSPTVKQLNVFTHKKDFLHMLCDKMPDNKTLQVRSDKASGSRFDVLDVEEDRSGDHMRMIKSMLRYLEEDYGLTETMQGNFRKIFETVLKTKYCDVLAPNIASKQGLAALLKTLFEAGLLDEAIKPRLFDLCSVANGSHHGEIVDAPRRNLTRGEILPLIRESLELVHKV